MFLNSLPEKTKQLFIKLSQEDFLTDFYLSGGTALSLQLNHRQSEDLDFFSQNLFDPQILLEQLNKFGQTENVVIEKGTLNLYLNQTKLQFLYYPYKLLESFLYYEKIKISSILDIACTKLITISDRGSKKDFIDLYFLLQKFQLKEILDILNKKYQSINYNKIHILKSLLYFADADNQPMPIMIDKIDWNNIKEEIQHQVKSLQSLSK